MNTAGIATCHCIIGHPSSPKFLVVKHSDSWTPPVLKMPLGAIDFQVDTINEAMENKYGFKTRVLRQLISVPSYHCIELELAGVVRSMNFQGVWVDREQYQQFRSDRKGEPDPFDRWLQEKQTGEIPASRAPWCRQGWFDEVDHWIHFQLDKLGLQPTGSLQQFRAGWSASCLLRIPTSRGWVYFKAGYAKPPGEAAMVKALSNKWPANIFPPLVADTDRNWLLSQDFISEATVSPEQFPEFSRTLAGIQVESINYMEEWAALGCPRHNLDYLVELTARASDELSPFLREGSIALQDDELSGFLASLPSQAESCRRLQQFGIPDTLMHLDFRDDNMLMKDGSCRIIDWADVAVGFPFFSLANMFAHSEAKRTGESSILHPMPIEDDLLNEITEGYLEVFCRFAPMERLREALALTRKLLLLWSLCCIRHELDWVEKDSPRYLNLSAALQTVARRMSKRSAQT